MNPYRVAVLLFVLFDFCSVLGGTRKSYGPPVGGMIQEESALPVIVEELETNNRSHKSQDTGATQRTSENTAPQREPTQDSPLGNKMYGQSLKEIELSSPELLSAKTLGIVTFGPRRDLSYTWWGKPYFVPEGANIPRDREIVEKEIRKWNRYTVVEDPRQAELVMALREWDHHSWRLGNATAMRLVIFRGGPEFEQKAEILSAQQVDWINAGAQFSAVQLLCDFRRRVEKLSKANGQTPPRSAGECSVEEYTDNPYWELPKGNPLRNKMYAEPFSKELAHAPELLSAKTVAIVTFGAGVPKSSPFYDWGANALRATDEVKEEIRSWKRYILVEDPRQADIVIAVREWKEKGFCWISWGCTKTNILSRLAVFKGGANFDQDLEVLWADRFNSIYLFRRDVDRLSKEQ